MFVEIVPCLKDNYSYVIIDPKTNKTCVVDPGESTPIIKFLEKKKLKLDYILNTHHHYDHIGGNEELKKKYNALVVGYKGDKNRIPSIDIEVEDQQTWSSGNFNTKIIFIPGHTIGHICFHFFGEKILFTGDTLFSLGCGRLFEGTYEQMWTSLEKIKALPRETKIYCGHEYTKKNSEFCIAYDPDNNDLKKKINEINEKSLNNLPTIPTTLGDEITTNIFLRSNNDDIKRSLNLVGSNSLEVFSKLRDLKDNF